MSEKKGGLKVLVWLTSFLVIAALGFFGLTKYSETQKKEKLGKGEAIVVTLVVGDVQVKKMGATDYRDVYVDDVLAMGDSVKTGTDAYCEIQMINRGIFRVEGNSDLLLAKLVNVDGKVDSRMKLNKGEVALKPKQLQKGETFEVETSTAVAAVRGTKFSVKTDDEGNTKVAVVEGKVAVTPNITSIDEARDKGLVSPEAAQILNDNIVKPVDVVPGEELKMDSQNVEIINQAIGQAVEDLAKEEGPITETKLATAPTEEGKVEVKQEISQKLAVKAQENIKKTVEQKIEEIKKEGGDNVKIAELTKVAENNKTLVTSGKGMELAATLTKKTEISEESKKVLEKVDEAKISQKVDEMYRIRIDSAPGGAEVYINGEKMGVTPFDQIVVKDTKFSVKLMKQGYKDFVQDVVADKVRVTVRPNLEVVKAEEDKTADEVAKADETKTDEAKADETKTEEVERIMPGTPVWNKPVAFASTEEIDQSVVVGDLVITTARNKLYILNLEGNLVAKVDVVSPDVKLSRPAVGNGAIYVGSEAGGLHAFSLTGAKLWTKDAGKMTFGASPDAGYGLIAAPSIDKGIKVYNTGGALVASIDISEQIFSSPVITGGGTIVVYATERGEVIGYNINEKREIWKKKVFDKQIVHPLLGNNKIVAVFDRSSGKLVGLNPESGEQMWEKDVAGAVGTKFKPIYNAGLIILLNQGMNRLYMVNIANGGIIYAKNYETIAATPFFNSADRTLYVGSTSGTLYGHNFNTGEDWTAKANGPISAVAGTKDGAFAVTGSTMFKYVNQ